ncbi:hypothetical protein [Denitratisoma oestradiolicum]|uniref:Uncharacterized protein n=1 Tax=Denitratisoma oestradiolicum TaxID=311182 RepID=A0A6S6XSR3_9PROT|nr:hypothetical protein [Denitratisoma oestradiolicum]TWO81096.1 hypothetical protein CBW56_05670 [Denitratisoma oestradiolicum]CAB1367775.1 conserved exported protein of unknown function [Denitratisoma oestradiolicum]
MNIRNCLPLLLLGASPAFAQGASKPPVATYWLSAETSSGLPMGGGAPSMGDMARMALGGGMSTSSRRMLLQLGSQKNAGADPTAEHQIPAGLNMGRALPLVTPQKAPAPPPASETEAPGGFERPKGRLLIFWGCGEQARAGQPLVIDFAKMASSQWPGGLFSRRLSLPTPPAPGRSRGYGDWPNDRDATRVPNEGSLQGDHLIQASYAPEIRFALDEHHDFLAPVELTVKKTEAAAMNVSWNSIANATGYFASVMGSKEGGEDMVWWTSSNSKEFGEQFFDYLPNAEVARLIKEKVLLPPATTECAVPAQVVAAAPQALLRFIAYGDEANFAHPPRPKDPKARWEPEWFAKARFKSTAFTPLMEAMPQPQEARPSPTDILPGGGAAGAVKGVLKGIFGF